MAVLVIRNDNDCEEVYNRTTVFCYTRMPRANLWEYVERLELLTADRQELFFKIDVDIFAAPDCLADLKEWNILSIVLKARIGPFSFGVLIKLFYELFPLKLMVDFSSNNIFISSGSLSNDGKALTSDETVAFQRLSDYHKQTLVNSMEAAESFKTWSNCVSSEVLQYQGASILVELANKYNIMGGYWIMFFIQLDSIKGESAFNLLLEEAYKNWGPISRFNAKISSDNFIICFGNKLTTSVLSPGILNSNKPLIEKEDPGTFTVRQIFEKIYQENCHFFGGMFLRYKPEIMSACCVQRDNFIRPTTCISTSCEYFGLPLGSLQNLTTPGIFGQIWLANSTAIQITNFTVEKYQKQEIIFAFISDESVEPVKYLYKVGGASSGEEMLFAMKRRLDGGLSEQRLVAIAPHGTTIDQWKKFGLVTGKSKKQLSVIHLNKKLIPQKFCCIKNKEKPDQGIIGDHYNAATGPILVEDSKTLVLQKFSLEANKAPDAWIFAGKGDVRQSTGKKALVLGRDSLNKHCSLRDYYSGDSDLRVRLAPGQDIYQVDYLSLFCYQYDVDFGHVSFQLDPKENPVPAYIPEIANAFSITKTADDPELLENNDLEGSC
ncbi:hypothetical protein Mgra_00009257 [Meloidogyne graminicola]|uniref:DM13 domain-containing protein n=1 Tax=Meloidogyne graminicola TaxID=189291 RepID=A0A8S9ZDI2_9BILA|nr:hypothetical protein Mgra_00009257 [Meloidogyne graminicola]